MNAEVRRELERLLSGLCDAQLSEAEHARLEQLLEADEEGRRLYLEYLDMHARLLVHPGLGGASSAIRAGEFGRARPWAVGGTGVSLRAGGRGNVGGFAADPVVSGPAAGRRGQAPPIEPASPGYVATLVQAAGCVWEGPGQPAATGVPPAPGELRLVKGIARIRSDGGSALVIEAPTVLRLEAGARSHRGARPGGLPGR